MVRIIETNLMLDEKLNNFQSRIIEVESWEYIVDLFTSGGKTHPKNHRDIFNKYAGVIIPKSSQIENLEYDEIRLTCDIVLWNEKRIRKLIQKY